MDEDLTEACTCHSSYRRCDRRGTQDRSSNTSESLGHTNTWQGTLVSKASVGWGCPGERTDEGSGGVCTCQSSCRRSGRGGIRGPSSDTYGSLRHTNTWQGMLADE